MARQQLFAELMWLNVPTLNSGQYIFRASQFIVRTWRSNGLATYLSSDRTSFYKIFHVTSGRGLLVASSQCYFLKAGDVAFIQPDEPVFLKVLSEDIDGHFCFVHPKFFRQAGHVLDMFVRFPYAHSAPAVVPLDRGQSVEVGQSFEHMLRESVGDHSDKKQAILLHLQMILLKVRRAGSAPCQVPR